MDKLRHLVRNDFENRFDRVQRVVKSELHTLRGSPQPVERQRLRLLGMFIGVCLRERGISEEAFARTAGIAPAMAQALLAGELQQDLVTDDLLSRVGAVLGYRTSLLRRVAGESTSDRAANAAAARKRSAERRDQLRSARMGRDRKTGPG
jgi:hypothetical protein